MQFDSLEFYKKHAQRYSQLSHEYAHSVYTDSSHPAVNGDMDLLNRVAELASGKRGLDAGCGAGARDVYLLHTWGYDAYGIDAVEENINLGKELHPEIADKLNVADMREPLAFETGFFDLVLCNAVIQHLPPETAEARTVPELARVLAPGGVLQLMFKSGSGVATVSDRAYGADGVDRSFQLYAPAYGADGVDRSFQLYDEHRLLRILEDCGCSLVEAGGGGDLGGMLYFSDPKPMRYCAFWVRKNLDPSSGQRDNGRASRVDADLLDLAYRQPGNAGDLTLESRVGTGETGNALQRPTPPKPVYDAGRKGRTRPVAVNDLYCRET